MKYLDAGVVVSDCGTYRYRLWRTWAPRPARVLWVMLNPRTADGALDDPTIRKCVGFATRWGFGGVEVVNLFAYRATSPDKLISLVRWKGLARAVGPENDRAIADAAGRADAGAGLVVCAWGANASRRELRGCGPAVVRLLRSRVVQVPVVHLGCADDGSPRHPLMLAYSTPRVAL